MLKLINIIFLFIVGLSCSKKSPVDFIQIAVIPKGTSHEFWKSVHAGAIKAEKTLLKEGTKVRIFWKGPLREDDREQQIQVVENFISREVDGIVLAPLDDNALVWPVISAMAKNIPVVVIDSDLNTDKRVSYIATDNYNGGVVAAKHLAQLMGNKGNVIIMRYQAGSASTDLREKGFIDKITNDYSKIKIISMDQYAGATREAAYTTAQNLLNRYGKKISGIFTPNESTTVGVVLALKDLNMTNEQIHLVGFDASTRLITALEEKQLDAVVVQNPMGMGYNGVMTIVKHIKGETVKSRIDTGVELVTFENMNSKKMQALLNPPIEEYLQEK